MTGRSSLQIAIAALSLFALGAVAGIATDRLLHRPIDREHIVIGNDTLLLQQIHDDPVAALDKTVGLRPGQREKLSAILARRQESIDALWSDTQQRVKASVDSMVNEVAAALDPDQREKFLEVARRLHSQPHVIYLRRH